MALLTADLGRQKQHLSFTQLSTTSLHHSKAKSKACKENKNRAQQLEEHLPEQNSKCTASPVWVLLVNSEEGFAGVG